MAQPRPQLRQAPLPVGPTRARAGGVEPACADTVSAVPTSPPGGVIGSHIHPAFGMGCRASRDMLRSKCKLAYLHRSKYGQDGLQVRHRDARPSGRRRDDAGTCG
jgi:hypothetical protein